MLTLHAISHHKEPDIHDVAEVAAVEENTDSVLAGRGPPERNEGVALGARAGSPIQEKTVTPGDSSTISESKCYLG